MEEFIFHLMKIFVPLHSKNIHYLYDANVYQLLWDSLYRCTTAFQKHETKTHVLFKSQLGSWSEASFCKHHVSFIHEGLKVSVYMYAHMLNQTSVSIMYVELPWFQHILKKVTFVERLFTLKLFESVYWWFLQIQICDKLSVLLIISNYCLCLNIDYVVWFVLKMIRFCWWQMFHLHNYFW